jgi:uncharacterized protein (DUF1697 family)
MKKYVVLLRGINVGGKNKVSMATLKTTLEEMGFENVVTYINSGNIVLQSALNAKTITQQIETMLPLTFKLDSSLIKVLVLTHEQLRAIVKSKPQGFGEHSDTYHSDVIFLMGISENEALKVFSPREGVDTVWSGKGVIYSQRLSSERTKSRLNKIVGTPVYAFMTIRNWNTTTKLLQMLSLEI